MSSPAHTGWFSAGTLLSCVTLLLFCAGFLRVELKMKEQEIRMDALEVKLSSQSAQQHSAVFGEWLDCTIDSLLASCNLDSQTELTRSLKVVPENNVFSYSAIDVVIFSVFTVVFTISFCTQNMNLPVLKKPVVLRQLWF